MHPSRKRPRMTERGRAAEAAADEFRRVYVRVLKGGDAEEFRRVYVLKKMFDKWSEAVLEVVPAVAPSLIGPVRGFMKARRTRPWLSEGAGGAHPTPQPPTDWAEALPSHVLLNIVLQLQRVQQALLRDTGLHDAELVQEEPRTRNSSK